MPAYTQLEESGLAPQFYVICRAIQPAVVQDVYFLASAGCGVLGWFWLSLDAVGGSLGWEAQLQS